MKIIMVDFREKKLQGSFEEPNKEHIDKIHDTFKTAVTYLDKLDIDPMYKDYCVHTLAQIVLNLRGRV